MINVVHCNELQQRMTPQKKEEEEEVEAAQGKKIPSFNQTWRFYLQFIPTALL